VRIESATLAGFQGGVMTQPITMQIFSDYV
jgi:hypothetical protein